jgi:hypothetical protein
VRARLAEWAALLRPGDVLTLCAALAVCVLSAVMLWRGGAPDKAVVRAGGKVVAEIDLARPRVVEVPGPIGVTRIEVEPGRARVAADPGPRQYCVRQGWLSRSGAVAICAPNQVSLSLTGGSADYDSLNY